MLEQWQCPFIFPESQSHQASSETLHNHNLTTDKMLWMTLYASYVPICSFKCDGVDCTERKKERREETAKGLKAEKIYEGEPQ